LLFRVLLPGPPIVSFFPYTTLFRSPRSRLHLDEKPGRTRGLPAPFPPCTETVLGAYLFTDATSCLLSSETRACMARHRALGLDGDRKSTRLNSSHVSISYAVFCLTK